MMSPPQSSSPLPTLFLTEAVLKLIGGSIFIFSPSTILTKLTDRPSETSLSLIRSLGTQTIAFSIPLFLAARRDQKSLASRRLVYWTVLGREGILAAGIVGQIVWLGVRKWFQEKEVGSCVAEYANMRALEEGVAEEKAQDDRDWREGSRLLKRGLWLWVAELAPFVVGRLWILKMRPEWFES